MVDIQDTIPWACYAKETQLKGYCPKRKACVYHASNRRCIFKWVSEYLHKEIIGSTGSRFQLTRYIFISWTKLISANAMKMARKVDGKLIRTESHLSHTNTRISYIRRSLLDYRPPQLLLSLTLVWFGERGTLLAYGFVLFVTYVSKSRYIRRLLYINV